MKHEAPSNKGTATFQSAARRFDDSKNGGRSLTPGPGAYSGVEKNELIKKSFSTMKTNFALVGLSLTLREINFLLESKSERRRKG